LEKKLLVKSIKPVNSKNRKIWLLWDIQPSEEFTGGIWYRDNEIDNELIQALYSKTV
jgi:DNA-directed RNA polymerase III subunit RPC6